MRHLARPATLAALFALAGCVGAPAPGPVAYTPYQNPGYAPPVGYSPQPGYSQGYVPPAPAAAQQVALGGRCYAGVYTCALPEALPVGASCSCPGLGAPSFGNVR